MTPSWLKSGFKLVGWLAILTIAVLSLVPGEIRPHTLSVSQLEHVIAYAITGALLAVGYPILTQRVLIVAGLTCYAGILEIIQLWVPGRTSKIIDLVAGSSGALAGVLLVLALQSWLFRTAEHRPAHLSSKLRG
jgi:hypothetical protein